MVLDNDTRGWIMTAVSGIACCFGASIICVDIIVRRFPGMKDFSITESETFLSASLSLSFGVMLFSSLYSMLPQSKQYLSQSGYSPRAASFLLIGLFLAGVIVIRGASNVLHHYMPSHVVDCDHTHDKDEEQGHNYEQNRNEMAEHYHKHAHTDGQAHDDNEVTPLLANDDSGRHRTTSDTRLETPKNGSLIVPDNRPGIARTITRSYSKYIQGQKENCDEGGPCKGFSKPCGSDCFKSLQRRSSLASSRWSGSRQPTWNGFTRGSSHANNAKTSSAPDSRSRSQSKTNGAGTRSRSATHHYHHPEGEHPQDPPKSSNSIHSATSHGQEHHHHVPTNAFMSIGLQTSIAIALHKAPEGFITYATNHANPTLGFAVFMALFIHNITEGFAMSLPLYLALNSRAKAILWSSFLGGVSQPLGAGVAALWFSLAQKSGHGSPDEGIYGGMFAVTAGIMTSVALSLFSESLTLSHKKDTCIAFAFVGMGILGTSSALTAR